MKPIIVITGPTASGKTRRAVDVACALGGEIVSADSRQVYRGMDIGTGKDLGEYGQVPVHLVDICPAGYKYNLFEWLRDASAAIGDILSRGRVPVVCGGTGLYIEALLKGLDLPQVPCNRELREKLSGKTLAELTSILSGMKTLHNTTDVDSVKRAIRAIEIRQYYIEHPDKAIGAEPRPIENAVVIGVDIDRENRRRLITQRLHARLEAGMVDEVRHLLDNGVSPDDLIYYGLEYKYLTMYVLGRLTFDEMTRQLEIAIHQFAKRQMTWFRGMERRGFHLNWLPYDLPAAEFTSRVTELYNRLDNEISDKPADGFAGNPGADIASRR